MERNIKKKVNDYIDEFKQNLQTWFQDNNATIFVDNQNGESVCSEQCSGENCCCNLSQSHVTSTNKYNDFIQYMNDFPYIQLEKEDFQKRKRVKNNVPDYNRCIALKCNGERCSRKQKNTETTFCGTHLKGAPYGTINTENIQPKKTKVQLWLEEINGISRYIDNNNNIYSSEDIINSVPVPRIIGKYGIHQETGEYFMVQS